MHIAGTEQPDQATHCMNALRHGWGVDCSMIAGVRRRKAKGWEHPDLDDVSFATMLDALGDPVRLEVVRQLAASGGGVTGAFHVSVTGQTLSHHLRILADAGLVRVGQVGRFRRCELRMTEVENRFPGFLSAVLNNAGK